MPAPTSKLARLAGVLYALLILCGVASDGLVRSALMVPGDAESTAANLLAAETAFRVSVLADAVMVLCDVGLGVALLQHFWRHGPGLAVGAMAFRLAQAAVLALNLVWLLVAVPLASHEPALASLALEAHGLGYQLGLLLFAVNCALTATLAARACWPRGLVLGLVGSALVYGVGAVAAVVAPAVHGAMEAFYVVPLVAEVGVASFLLVRAGGLAARPRRLRPVWAVAGLALFAALPAQAGDGRLLVTVDENVAVVVDGTPLDGEPGTRTAVGEGIFGRHEVAIYTFGGRELFRGQVDVPDRHEVRCRWASRAFSCYASEPLNPGPQVVEVPRPTQTTTVTSGVQLTGFPGLSVGVTVHEQTTTASPGCTAPSTVRLVLRSTDGEWADVHVDGLLVAELRGEEEATVRITPGTHQVEVREFLSERSYAAGRLDTGCADRVTLGLTEHQPIEAYDTEGWTAR